ncbi:hypothetical protein [Corynebacterium diphtheriae]|uniref:hypothetical protein n=1 Tax=Corynebacterium diphtheriae TaxID=1717 RepID=UPI0002467E3B|nr:hypothetical protein [Corynebacterium diphtheriae]AEX67274.1 hypothetical protein CDC7B_1078 [Corynebacterium diphtheriae C7 (beta)]UEB35860.1 hypothetical protein LK418_03500 [Corynebacterium diphtheriae subsp. diphtheriae]CAB1048534.1 hypothetical protein NCTC11397BIS_01065 [Corynebacterium diphtheriae]CKG89158.1 Uncharacterised protein [Corynebacterium diphtheriae]
MSNKTNKDTLNHDDEDKLIGPAVEVEDTDNESGEPNYTNGENDDDTDDTSDTTDGETDDELDDFDDDIEWLNIDELNDFDDDEDQEQTPDDTNAEDTTSAEENTPDEDTADTFPKEYVDKLRRENLHRRKQNKEMREQMTTKVETAYQELVTQLAQAAGIEADNANDLAEKLNQTLQTERKQAQQARQELAIYKATQNADVDPRELTDSISFNNQLAKLNPQDGDYDDSIQNLVNQYAAKTNRAPKRTQRSGTDYSAGANTITADNSFESLLGQRRQRRGVNIN